MDSERLRPCTLTYNIVHPIHAPYNFNMAQSSNAAISGFFPCRSVGSHGLSLADSSGRCQSRDHSVADDSVNLPFCRSTVCSDKKKTVPCNFFMCHYLPYFSSDDFLSIFFSHPLTQQHSVGSLLLTYVNTRCESQQCYKVLSRNVPF